jgi:hypothetical protein
MSVMNRDEEMDRLIGRAQAKVSAEEFSSPLFKQMGKDGHGFVTMEEARAYYAGRRTAWRTSGLTPWSRRSGTSRSPAPIGR